MKSLPIIVALAVALLLTPSASFAQLKPNNPDKPVIDDPVQPDPPAPTPPDPPAPTPPPPDPSEPDEPDDLFTDEELYSDLLTATDPQTVMDALNKEGFRGEFIETKSGRIRIQFVISGSKTNLWFYDCNKEMKNCRTLLLNYGIDLDDGAKLSQANEWNSSQVWGRVYLDGDGDPWLDVVINTGDGLPRLRFGEVLNTWELLVGKFKTTFNPA